VFREDSTTEAWSRLGLYLSRDVLERRYRGRHGGELNAGKAREIIAHFEQAREYFDSAASAGVLAGPLEQYYGALSFARGLILYLKPKAREATLTKGHGLAAVIPADGPFEAARLSVEAGTFDEFLEATGNVEEILFETPRVEAEAAITRFRRHLKRPPVGAGFSLNDLLARIPAVRAHYEEAYQSSARCYRGHAWWFMGTVTVGLFRDRVDLPPDDHLLRAFDFESANPYPRRREFGLELSRAVRPDTSPAEYIPHAVETVSRDRVVIESYPEGWALSALASYLAAAHALSTLVRYHPTRWARLLSREHGDQTVPVLDRLRIGIQRDFVRLVLRELDWNDGEDNSATTSSGTHE
jgi:hypothetical protein